MGKRTTLEERVLMCELAEAGYSDREIAETLEWSVATVRKWRRRGRKGRQALASQMGRPPTGVLSTFAPLIGKTLRAWRDAHPGWGPKTLLAELEGDERLAQMSLPSERSIAYFLKEADLSRPYERHSPLPQRAHPLATVPHEVWEMDARGQERVPDIGIVTLINLNDRCSRLRLLSYPCVLGIECLEHYPTTEDYQMVMRLAFTEWGLPDCLRVDHDSVFYDNTSKSPFPTRFHLWLVALGVALTLGRAGHPTDQAVTERSHQTWDQQVLQGQSFGCWQALGDALRKRRDFLNYRLPCATLGDVPPLEAYPEARTPRRLYRPEWEADLLDLSSVFTYLGQGRWFRRVSHVGTLSLGSHIYGLGVAWKEQEVEITFDPSTRQLVFCSADGEQEKRLPIKGITLEALMGELGPLVGLPEFQLALPFSWDEWRVIQLCDTLGDTTSLHNRGTT